MVIILPKDQCDRCWVYRHKGWYFIYDSSIPGDIGPSAIAELPTDPLDFEAWLGRKRQYYDRLLEDHEDVLKNNGEYIDSDEFISRTRPNNDYFNGWVYELDLDRLVFHVDSMPVFRLDNMPPPQLALRGIVYNLYGCRAPRRDVPVECRFSRGAFPNVPPVENSSLETYQSSVQIGAPCTVNTLLSLDVISAREEVVVQERTLYFHECMRLWCRKVAEEFTFLPHAKAISPLGHCLAFNLAALALSPISYMFSKYPKQNLRDRSKTKAKPTPDQQQQPVNIPQGHAWWPRRHICVTLATHLVQEDNCKAAIVDCVEEVMKKDDASDVIYGVVFSVFDCVLVRINKNDGTFTHTEVLPYCFDIFSSTPVDELPQRTTTGFEAVVRLGTLDAQDDEDFFCDLLRPFWKSQQVIFPAPSDILQNSAAPPIPASGPRLPQDLLYSIAEFIQDSTTFAAFALASRSTMAAALPRLRLPNIFLPDAKATVILERCLPVAKGTRLAEATFCAKYKGRSVFVEVLNRIDIWNTGKGKSDRIIEVRDCEFWIPFVFEPPRKTLRQGEIDFTVFQFVQPPSIT